MIIKKVKFQRGKNSIIEKKFSTFIKVIMHHVWLNAKESRYLDMSLKREQTFVSRII